MRATIQRLQLRSLTTLWGKNLSLAIISTKQFPALPGQGFHGERIDQIGGSKVGFRLAGSAN